MTAHSELGASKYERWGACPGSVRKCRGTPERSSEYAREGTAAHTLGEACLTGNLKPHSFIGKAVGAASAGQDDRIVVTEEMADAVKVYVDTVRNDIGAPCEDVVAMFEHAFDLSAVHPGMFGTADAVVLYKHAKLLRVYDFKYGAGIFVDVEQNKQLMYYGLGALLSMKSPVSEVELIIVQPRIEGQEPVRRWRFPSVDILDFRADLKAAARATEDPNAPLVPGDHCRFCPAAAICEAPRHKAEELFADLDLTAPTLDYAQVATALRWLPTLKGWMKAVEEFAYSEANAGRTIPGFKLVEKRASRKWGNGAAEDPTWLGFLRSVLGSEAFEPPSLKSPAQVEKLLPKSDPKLREEFEKRVVKESSGTVLVPDEDKRPAVSRVNDFSILE